MDNSKTCFKCGTEQPLTNFYAHPMMADGHVNKCKDCNKRDVQQNYKNKREQYVEYDRQRNSLPHRVEARRMYAKHLQETDPERVKEYRRRSYRNHAAEQMDKQKCFRDLFPSIYKARTQLGNAIRDGKIQRKPCVVCGDANSHGHHEDYRHPLEVMWLCPLHHKARHKELKGLGIEIPY